MDMYNNELNSKHRSIELNDNDIFSTNYLTFFRESLYADPCIHLLKCTTLLRHYSYYHPVGGPPIATFFQLTKHIVKLMLGDALRFLSLQKASHRDLTSILSLSDWCLLNLPASKDLIKLALQVYRQVSQDSLYDVKRELAFCELTLEYEKTNHQQVSIESLLQESGSRYAAREDCPICQTPVRSYPLPIDKDAIYKKSKCHRGHIWHRCSISQLLITTPFVRTCSCCGQKSLCIYHPKVAEEQSVVSRIISKEKPLKKKPLKEKTLKATLLSEDTLGLIVSSDPWLYRVFSHIVTMVSTCPYCNNLYIFK